MFNPEYGLFTITNSTEQLLYPNPNAYSILISSGCCNNKNEVNELYVFLGRILGIYIYIYIIFLHNKIIQIIIL